MTPQQIRIAVAEECGWKHFRSYKEVKCPDGSIIQLHRWVTPQGETRDYSFDSEKCNHIPDYPNDLNAIHEAEKCLTINQSRDYLYWLQAITKGSVSDAEDWMKCMVVIHAPALQRCEAFLKTVGRWKD